MTVIGEAFIAIRPELAQFQKDVEKGVTTTGQKVAKTLAATIGGAFVIRGLRDFAKEGIAELEEAAAAQAQTAAAIKSTGGAANVTAQHIEDLAGRQLKLTGVDDELIQKGENLLLTFTGVRNEVGKGNDIFDRATVAALDLSRAGFGSVESASVLLGKALNDPVNGLTALQRVGVRLTDDQKALVKELVATGDTLGAQKVILEEVNRQVGGSAEAYGKTLPGQLAIARESLDNTKGALLAGMAPALKFTAGAATFLTDQFAKQPAALQSVEGGLLLVVGGLGSIITPLKSGIDLWRSFGTTASAAADISQPVLNSADAVGDLYTSTARLGTVARVALVGGVAALGAGIAYMAQQSTNAHVDVDELSRGVADLSDSSQQQVKEFIAGASAMGQFDTVVRQLADGNVIAADRLLDTADAMGINSDQVARGRKIVEDKRRADAQGSADSKKYGEQQEVTTAAIEAGVDPTEALAGATGELGVASDGTSGQLTTYADKLQAARDAVDALFDTTESAIDADFRYQDAKDASADALENLSKLQLEGKGFTDEYRRAQDDAAEAMFNQAQAAADSAVQNFELSGATLDASDKARIQKQELEKLRDTLAPNSPLRDRLQGMIDKLGAIPRSKKVTVDVLTGQALVDIDRFAKALHDKLIRQGIRVSVGGGGGVQLSGGGEVPLYAAQGVFVPRGTDTVPAMLTPGEWVINRQAAQYWGSGMMDAINRMAPMGNVAQVTFAAGSVVVQAAAGMTHGEAASLGASLIQGAAREVEARRIGVLGRVL